MEIKILIAEDDTHTRNGLKEIFDNEGYLTFTCDNGEQAFESFLNFNPDIICLDIMMPKINGYDLIKKIRKVNEDIPILFISAKSEEIDKVLGLELGADDFIVKPFGVKEVIARVRAVSRRYLKTIIKAESKAINQAKNANQSLQFFSNQDDNKQSEEYFIMKSLKIFPLELRAYRGKKQIDLSLREVKILKLFYSNSGRVLSRDFIFDNCWSIDYIPSSRTLDQHISQLRKKIEINKRDPEIIKTIPGAGYRFE